MICLEVAGIPAPQGSKTPIHRDGKTWMIEGGSKTGREKHANWRQDVMYAARDYICEHPMPPLDGPVQVTVVFRFPQLTGDKYRTMHSTKPDADKLLRATFDALVAAGMIVDDARITAGSWTKLYARPPMTPGATITVEPLGTTEASMREALKAAAKAARKA